MRTIYKIILTIIVLILCSGIAVIADDSSLSNLASPIYQDLERWNNAGYFYPLPPLRPYSPAVIIDRLKTMEDNPDISPDDKLRVEGYLADLTSKKPRIQLDVDVFTRFSNESHFVNIAPSFTFAWMLDNQEDRGSYAELYYSSNFLDSAGQTTLPEGQRESQDYVPDWADINLGDVNLSIRQYTHGLVSQHFTSGEGLGFTYLSIGTHRTSIGPIHNDGIIASDEAPAAGHISFSTTRLLDPISDNGFLPSLNLQTQFSMLSATDDFGEGVYGSKYMIFHDLYFDVQPWITLGFIESVVWGPRGEPYYFIPLASYFLSQGLVGFTDNSMIGLHATIKPAKNLRIPLVMYMDDIHFNDILSGNLDTKYKFAAQTAIQWTPLKPWLDSLSIDYTAVMPYMYTHFDRGARDSTGPTGDPNYSNYTNRGQNIGPGLEPNSDRIRLNWTARPLAQSTTIADNGFRELEINSRVEFRRHGNASAGIGTMPGDSNGDIFDPGYDDGGNPTFQPPFDDPTGQPYTRFLTQDVLENHLQLALGISTAIGFNTKHNLGIRLGLNYTFEYIWNYKLVENSNRANNFVEFTIRYGRLN